MTLLAETNRSIAAARHLDSEMYAGAIEALRKLAAKIDAWDVIVQWANEDVADEGSRRPSVPQNDNVSISAYMKALDALGLTPQSISARAPATAPKDPKGATDASTNESPPAGRLASIRSRRPA